MQLPQYRLQPFLLLIQGVKGVHGCDRLLAKHYVGAPLPPGGDAAAASGGKFNFVCCCADVTGAAGCMVCANICRATLCCIAPYRAAAAASNPCWGLRRHRCRLPRTRLPRNRRRLYSVATAITCRVLACRVVAWSVADITACCPGTWALRGGADAGAYETPGQGYSPGNGLQSGESEQALSHRLGSLSMMQKTFANSLVEMFHTVDGKSIPMPVGTGVTDADYAIKGTDRSAALEGVTMFVGCLCLLVF